MSGQAAAVTNGKIAPVKSTGIKKLIISSTFRLALVYMALFIFSVLVLMGFIYWSTTAYSSTQSDATIEAEIKGLAERYDTDGVAGLTSQIADRLQRQRRQPGDAAIYLLTDRAYRPIVGNIDRWPAVQADDGGWLDFRLGDDGGENLHHARARVFSVGNRYFLLVGRDMFALEKNHALIIKTLIWGGLIMLGLALLGGIMMSRSVIRRIDTINKTSHAIMSGDLSLRIPSRKSGDEFDQLSDNLNHMLDQIELLMDGVKRVSDNIAHDLKTPLARLRNRLEALHSDSDDPRRVELVERALREADGLLETFNALLRIARIEADAQRAAFVEVDIAAVIRDVVDLYEPVAEDKNQRLRVAGEPAVSLSGDRNLLFQALANLIDNAIKYTPHDGTITVTVAPDRLVVCDSGAGIPQAERERVFQRFYRMDTSRNSAGAGLGLSLVRAVASLHRMEISLTDNHPGLCVALIWGSLQSK